MKIHTTSDASAGCDSPEFIQPFLLVAQSLNRSGFLGQVSTLAAKVDDVFYSGYPDGFRNGCPDTFLIRPEIRGRIVWWDHCKDSICTGKCLRQKSSIFEGAVSYLRALTCKFI